VTEATLSAIATELNLSVDLLMTLASKVPAEVKPKTPLEVELYRMVRQLPVGRQRELLDSLKQAAGGNRVTEQEDKEKGHDRC
jgi:hypothetical protein